MSHILKPPLQSLPQTCHLSSKRAAAWCPIIKCNLFSWVYSLVHWPLKVSLQKSDEFCLGCLLSTQAKGQKALFSPINSLNIHQNWRKTDSSLKWGCLSLKINFTGHKFHSKLCVEVLHCLYTSQVSLVAFT